MNEGCGCVPGLGGAGVTGDEIDRIRAGAGPLISRAVDELEAGSCLSDETYQALAAELDDRQLMDLAFTIGTYGALAIAARVTEAVRSCPERAISISASAKGTMA